MSGVFGDWAPAYARAGWPCVIPVPAEAKYPPPGGFTGADGADTAPEQLAAWAAGGYGAHSVALRMPAGVIGIDVDEYVKGGTAKHGAATLAAAEAAWGPLPPTWTSTARGAGQPSRIWFYRVPPQRYASGLNGGDVEIIQRHHRYAVVAPSPHHDAGAPYCWYAPDGQPVTTVPSPSWLAELPPSWVHGLAAAAAAASPAAADRDSGTLMLEAVLANRLPPCIEVHNAAAEAVTELEGAEAGSRHDMMTGHVYRLVQLGAEGHPGTGWMLTEWLALCWDRITAGENREEEFSAMLLSAARKAVTAHPVPAGSDPCLDARPLGWEAPVPDGADYGDADVLQPAAQWSLRRVWGVHPFETMGQLDAVLARDVLARTWPGLRYAADSGTWLLRGPLNWEARHGDLARWAVSEMFELMPRGDPAAPKDSPQYAVAARRARFGTKATVGAIAGCMTDQVLAYHPCSVQMAELDAEPEILWAGGLPWSLRESRDGPVVAAHVDPGTPHMHTAACAPEARPTPLWNAFIQAVWPEEALRLWNLRVLSVAFTGIPDKSLPILMGETDRGKTELVNLLMSVLGSYALKSADARLLNAADRSHASIVYALRGRRLAFIDEAPRAGHQAQERLKSLTGGAALTGNRMGENPITFRPTHTLVLTANPGSEPVLTDSAVRRRVRLLDCDGDPEAIAAARAAIGPLSGPAWRAEAPGVLAWMMAHAAAWLADPRSASNEAAPAFARKLAEAISLSQDLTAGWVEEETEPYPAGSPARDLYKRFILSCRERGITQGSWPTETRWGRRLTELGYPVETRRSGRYRPLRVRSGAATFADEKDEGFSGVLAHGSKNNPSPENPSSNYSQLSSVNSSDSSPGINAHTRATHAHTQGGRDNPQPVTADPRVRFAIDLETGDADSLFATQGDGFVRLAGAIGAAGQPVITTAGNLLELLALAGVIDGHNLLGYDLLALAWHYGADWESLASRARDTELLARQADPPRSRESGTSLDLYDLDHVAERLGVPGKTGSLAALKRAHGGYGRIPLDDPDYLAYLEGDLRATAAVAARLPDSAYTAREHALAVIAGRMTLNGFAVNRPLLDERYEAGQQRKADALQLMHDAWGLPVSKTVLRGRGKARAEVTEAVEAPLATDAGRAWLAGIWERYGVADPPRTPKAGKLKTGGDDLKPIADDPRCPPGLRSLLALMAIVTGTRTVYATALDNIAADGRVHPRISMRQASGRWSVTDPGLTVFGKREGRHRERDIFTPDEGHVLIAFDLAQVDMRAIAGHCQDPAYMALFAPGMDAHAEIAARVYGTRSARQAAKAVGHGWNYGLGGKRMIAEGMDPELVAAFIAGMAASYPQLIAWREMIREQGRAGEILDNGFGRAMRCDPPRAYTVAPALMGQGGARDIMCECLLRLPREVHPMLRVMVHDEIVLSVPKREAMEVAAEVKRAMTWEWRGVPVLCDMTAGMSWGECSAK